MTINQINKKPLKVNFQTNYCQDVITNVFMTDVLVFRIQQRSHKVPSTSTLLRSTGLFRAEWLFKQANTAILQDKATENLR